MNIQVERLKRLPLQAQARWQGGLFRMPAWVPDEQQKLFRPWSALWVNLLTHTISAPTMGFGKDKNIADALDGLVKFACDTQLAGYRPGTLEVKDAEVAEYLREQLADTGIAVVCRDRLPGFDEVFADLTTQISGREALPDALSAKHVTPDMMRSFAEAAAEYYAAKPWRHLSDVDLIKIERPSVDPLLRYASILGHAGITYGIGFYDSTEMYEQFVEGGGMELLKKGLYWALYFGGIEEMPFGDADLWEDHQMPAASPEAYPVLTCYSSKGKHRRPGPDVLAFMEGLMRAFALTTESEMDSGRWEKTVSTMDGDETFILTLPDLLESAEDARKRKIKTGYLPDRRAMEKTHLDIQRILEGHDFSSTDEMQAFVNANLVGKPVPSQHPVTALEQAQYLCYEAFEARGRKQIQLAKKALEICPDCVDAYVILAEACCEPQESYELYAKGVAAGQRLLGEQFFKEEAGHFWGIIQTRPYMRARLGLAECLDNMGQLDDAITHYQEMLRLNPNDNQGVRELLLACLLETKRLDEADALLKEYKESGMALWNYSRALLTFLQKGNSATARKQLSIALKVNPYVADYLLEDEDLPPLPQSYRLGSQEEAVICADILQKAWDSAPKALEWLREQMESR